MHFCDGLLLFECSSLTASIYHSEQYEHKKHFRADGKVHPVKDLNVVQRGIELSNEYKWITPRTHRGVRHKTVRIQNPDYESRQGTAQRLTGISARLGMRGAFGLLWRFSGTSRGEKIEFHNCWFEMVQQYSTRKLTVSSDKVKAVTGVAYFIQVNTSFTYVAGLWKEVLPLNLLWLCESKATVRPSRRVPTWSWASVDGTISHRLKASGEGFESTWKEIAPLISGEVVHAIEENVNNMILDASLTLQGCVVTFDLQKLNVIYDIEIDFNSLVESLSCFPVLFFKNKRVHPEGSASQVHGLVLRPISTIEESDQRVRYF